MAPQVPSVMVIRGVDSESSQTPGPVLFGGEAVSTSRLSTFERSALASSLLTREQLDTTWAALIEAKPGSFSADLSMDERLAQKLVQLGLLNSWQAQQLLAGRTKFNLGPYCIIDSIGSGGMGQVFKAVHGVMGRIVAVKVLPRNKCTPEAIANFVRESRAQAKLDHPNLVRALDAGQDGNVYYLVTEYVAGPDLRKLVRNGGPLGMESAASVVSQVAAGLQHAHERGVVHRDVKPGNVLVAADGVAKLSDLGLAGPLVADAEKDPRFGRDRGYGRLPLSRPYSGPVESHARLGHLFARLHALLRGDGQSSFSGRINRRQGQRPLQAASLGPPPVESPCEPGLH